MIDPSKLCYLLRRLVTLAQSRTKAYECFEQLLQFIYSLDVAMPERDIEWFVAKAWNIVRAAFVAVTDVSSANQNMCRVCSVIAEMIPPKPSNL